jgi:multiple sugar transport system permease protein
MRPSKTAPGGPRPDGTGTLLSRRAAPAARDPAETRLAARLLSRVDRHLAWLLPLPAVLALLVVLAGPLAYALWVSLTSWYLGSPAPPRFVGLANYAALLADPRVWHAAWVTFYFTGLALGLELLLGLGIALYLNREFVGSSLVRTVLLLPLGVTPVAIALVWAMMFNPTLGMLNYVLSLVGLPPLLWASDPLTALPSLVLVDVWQWTPMVVLLLLAGLQTIPTEILEAAALDGARGLRLVGRIQLPLIRPHLAMAAVFRVILLLKTFDLIYVITQGGPADATETLNLYTYQVGMVYFQMGYGSALAVVLLLVIMALSLVLLQARRRAWSY